MNKYGKQYIEDINQQVQQLDDKEKEYYKNYMNQDHQLEERIMRMGNEVKAFELTPNDYHTIALYTIRKDVLDKISTWQKDK